MKMQQLEINGIGQQVMTPDEWKQQNNIFTRELNDDDLDDGVRWACWDEHECVEEFASIYSYDSVALGESEKEAILSFCNANDIAPPFWW